jgi:hypothetical protein
VYHNSYTTTATLGNWRMIPDRYEEVTQPSETKGSEGIKVVKVNGKEVISISAGGVLLAVNSTMER